MRLILCLLCIIVILLASALILLGYDGTQLRDFLLGVTAVITVADRLLRPRKDAKPPTKSSKATDSQRESRLSDGRDDADTESELPGAGAAGP